MRLWAGHDGDIDRRGLVLPCHQNLNVKAHEYIWLSGWHSTMNYIQGSKSVSCFDSRGWKLASHWHITERIDGSCPNLILIKGGMKLLNMYFLYSLFKSICFLGVVEHERNHCSREGIVGNWLIDLSMYQYYFITIYCRWTSCSD